MKVIFADPGINPLEMPEIIRHKRQPWKLVLAILLLLALCLSPIWFIARAAGSKPTATATITPEWTEATATASSSPSPAPSATANPTRTATATTSPAPTKPGATAVPKVIVQTQIITQQVTKIVNIGSGVREITVETEREVEVTREVMITATLIPSATATPRPSPTPWDCIQTKCYYQILGVVFSP